METDIVEHEMSELEQLQHDIAIIKLQVNEIHTFFASIEEAMKDHPMAAMLFG